MTDGSRPLRGGIPVCFPQFSDCGPLEKQHGFARDEVWELWGGDRDSSGDDDDGGGGGSGATDHAVALALDCSGETAASSARLVRLQAAHPGWHGGPFCLVLGASLRGPTLEVTARLTGPGPSLSAGLCLHAYLSTATATDDNNGVAGASSPSSDGTGTRPAAVVSGLDARPCRDSLAGRTLRPPGWGAGKAADAAVWAASGAAGPGAGAIGRGAPGWVDAGEEGALLAPGPAPDKAGGSTASALVFPAETDRVYLSSRPPSAAATRRIAAEQARASPVVALLEIPASTISPAGAANPPPGAALRAAFRAVSVRSSSALPDLVLWSPGREKAAGMMDLGDSETHRFVCLEPADTGLSGEVADSNPRGSGWRLTPGRAACAIWEDVPGWGDRDNV